MQNPTDPLVVRAQKLEALIQMGVDPYPHCFHRTHLAEEVKDAFAELEEQKPVAVAGRLRSLRPMGKTAFGHLEDPSGLIQVYLRLDILGEEAYRVVPLLDLGDLIGARGRVFRTRMGEVSIRVEALTLLAKALRPMPVVKEKEGRVFDAFSDREMRYRRRDLDLMVNPETRELFRRRAATLQALRRYLDERGFLEVETPVLQTVYGGATARPFRTHHNVLDMDLYLRIAEELPLKKLLVGGLERVYEIGRVFRNEGVDRHHNPEFTLLEFYWAYADYQDAMELVEDMLRQTARAVTGGLQLTQAAEEEGRSPCTVDLAAPFARRSMVELIREETGADVLTMTPADLVAWGERLGGGLPPGSSAGKWIEKIFDLAVAPKLMQPTFVTDHPKAISPLAKAHRLRPGELVERFELFILGQEFANAFTELNDPLDQRRRFEDQRKLREAGDPEAQPLDEEFLQALEQGMPPSAGVGIGVDRLVMLLTGAAAIKDVLLFPHMRPLGSAGAPSEAQSPSAARTDEVSP
ncbi:MAG: lysine--tRNA ligase [Candidatus Eisenbacteria bacterium]